MKTTAAVILMGMALSGCVTDEQACSSYGFARGTTQFSQCLMNRDLVKMQAKAQILSSPSGMHCTTMAGQTTCNAY